MITISRTLHNPDSEIVMVDLGFGDDFFEQDRSWDDFSASRRPPPCVSVFLGHFGVRAYVRTPISPASVPLAYGLSSDPVALIHQGEASR